MNAPTEPPSPDMLLRMVTQWQEMHLREHQSERLALSVAVGELNRRLSEMNELRRQIESERGQFVARDMFDREFRTLRDTVDIRLKLLETQAANFSGRLWMMGAAISSVMVILNFAARWWK